jgi:hypothetical protein
MRRIRRDRVGPRHRGRLWLSLYPAAYAGVVWLARSRGAGRAPAGVWLDGIVAGLGIAAIGAAIVFRPVLATATGSALAVTTNLAYPSSAAPRELQHQQRADRREAEDVVAQDRARGARPLGRRPRSRAQPDRTRDGVRAGQHDGGRGQGQ